MDSQLSLIYILIVKYMRKMNKIWFKDIEIKVFYKANNYISFFVPFFLIVVFLENIADLFGLKILASGLLLSARKWLVNIQKINT